MEICSNNTAYLFKRELFSNLTVQSAVVNWAIDYVVGKMMEKNEAVYVELFQSAVCLASSIKSPRVLCSLEQLFPFKQVRECVSILHLRWTDRDG